jgi:hypothetical protein
MLCKPGLVRRGLGKRRLEPLDEPFHEIEHHDVVVGERACSAAEARAVRESIAYPHQSIDLVTAVVDGEPSREIVGPAFAESSDELQDFVFCRVAPKAVKVCEAVLQAFYEGPFVDKTPSNDEQGLLEKPGELDVRIAVRVGANLGRFGQLFAATDESVELAP